MGLMTGIDLPIPACQLIIHQPTIKEISYLGESDFFIGIQTLILNKSMFIKDESALDQISNFQIFMMVMQEEETKDKKDIVIQVLQLLFPKYKVLFTPRALMFQEKEQMYMVDESNFDQLQEIIKLIMNSNNASQDQQAFNPEDERARQIAEKLMRGRQIVAEQKGTVNASLFAIYTSVLSVGMGIPLTDFMDYTVYQLYDQMERYSLHVSWDIDVRSRLAGAKMDEKPPDWMKNLHNEKYIY